MRILDDLLRRITLILIDQKRYRHNGHGVFWSAYGNNKRPNKGRKIPTLYGSVLMRNTLGLHLGNGIQLPEAQVRAIPSKQWQGISTPITPCNPSRHSRWRNW